MTEGRVSRMRSPASILIEAFLAGRIVEIGGKRMRYLRAGERFDTESHEHECQVSAVYVECSVSGSSDARETTWMVLSDSISEIERMAGRMTPAEQLSICAGVALWKMRPHRRLGNENESPSPSMSM